MIIEPNKSIPNGDDRPILKVRNSTNNTLSVYFPFSDVPVHMTPSYFEKHIDVDKYIIDFDDDRTPLSS